jgi:hypothetical protein
MLLHSKRKKTTRAWASLSVNAGFPSLFLKKNPSQNNVWFLYPNSNHYYGNKKISRVFSCKNIFLHKKT